MSGFRFEFKLRCSDWKDVKFIIYNILSLLALALYVVSSYIWSIQANIHHLDDVVLWTGIGGMAIVFGVSIVLTERLAWHRLDVMHSQITVSPNNGD